MRQAALVRNHAQHVQPSATAALLPRGMTGTQHGSVGFRGDDGGGEQLVADVGTVKVDFFAAS
jgi:hypothetical protein